MRLQSRSWPEQQSHEGLTGTEEFASKMAHSDGCWQEASAPHTGFSRGLLMAWLTPE